MKKKLFVKEENYEFDVTISFLGFVIYCEIVREVKKLPVPKTRKQAGALSGICQFPSKFSSKQPYYGPSRTTVRLLDLSPDSLPLMRCSIFEMFVYLELSTGESSFHPESQDPELLSAHVGFGF